MTSGESCPYSRMNNQLFLLSSRLGRSRTESPFPPVLLPPHVSLAWELISTPLHRSPSEITTALLLASFSFFHFPSLVGVMTPEDSSTLQLPSLLEANLSGSSQIATPATPPGLLRAS
ncbi:hypothetical protein CRG98_021218 [Punica granatum]|uniref:Uncharacterized protein n=1 Tax=Punica granatum TaxID=22663 RepID=A0A2I0JR64_PUNGR|nr:hypothetical protein CRG98_021218 [Punica granatum]